MSISVDFAQHSGPPGLLWQVYGRGKAHKGLAFASHLMIHDRYDHQSANYVRQELPVRLAHRIRDLQALPYVVVTQEGVAKVYEVR